MKMIKKITSVFMTFLIMAALVIGSTSVVFAADKVDDTVKSTLVTTAEGLTDAIVQLKDEEIENYMSSGDDFTTSAMQSWQTSKDELGAKKDSNGETTVTFKDDQYTVTVPLKFEKAEANFVYVFDSQGTPTSMSVDVQYGMGKTLQRAGLNTLMGIGTVFVMLILLSLLISLFRFIPNPEAKKAAEAKAAILANKTALGIEFGSTRIKAVLVDDKNQPIASGGHEWENRYENGVWTYSLDDIWTGIQDCYQDMARDVKAKYDIELESVGAFGVSAMMHGYMPFDKEGNLLVPFRTWRNNITGEASEKLMELFNYNIPQRWSIAHLYQCILDKEDHVKDIAFTTTLAGYIHWQMTGEKVLGVGDASGMFPIDMNTKDYDEEMIQKFDKLIEGENYPWKIKEILPKVLVAGDAAGILTEEGAKKLDPTGNLEAGIPLCPPEGDAGTGMVATNSVAQRTSNISAGTSFFSMVVLEKPLKDLHTEIDMVTTPDGSLVAMVHSNNGTTDLNAWVNLFKEFADSIGADVDMNQMYGTLYNKALEGDADCGGILSYGNYAGEPITNVEKGRPMVVRTPETKFNLANFMRSHLYTALGVIKVGMDILTKDEGVEIDTVLGHGGLFKTKGVGQKILADAINTPVVVMETAGEGGPWGMAILAEYMVKREEGEKLEDYLKNKVFGSDAGSRIDPDPEGVAGYEAFMETYKKGLDVERRACADL